MLASTAQLKGEKTVGLNQSVRFNMKCINSKKAEPEVTQARANMMIR